MQEDKYEYMFHTWGGFYNKQHKDIHGKEEGYFFFDTKEDRERYLNDLLNIEKQLNAIRLVYTFEEGNNVRYKTIAKMQLLYNNKWYDFSYDFGHAYSEKNAHFMFHEGNYACDCNKLLFLNEAYGDEIQINGNCGGNIEIRNFEVIFEK